jgi:excisionase family DNA binding protein
MPVNQRVAACSRSVVGVNAQTRRRAARTREDAPQQLISLAAGAAYSDVSVRTLRRYIAQGRLTGYRVGPRLVKVDLNELRKLASPIPTAKPAAHDTTAGRDM